MTNRICPCTGCDAHPSSCPNIVTNGRCTRCRRQAQANKGTTTQQGRGWQHQKRRAKLIAQAIGTNCPDCLLKGKTTIMADPSQMVADHTIPLLEDPNSAADRVHCLDCSNSQGGTLSRRYT